MRSILLSGALWLSACSVPPVESSVGPDPVTPVADSSASKNTAPKNTVQKNTVPANTPAAPAAESGNFDLIARQIADARTRLAVVEAALVGRNVTGDPRMSALASTAKFLRLSLDRLDTTLARAKNGHGSADEVLVRIVAIAEDVDHLAKAVAR